MFQFKKMESRKANTYASANIFSKLFFFWMLPLFHKGANKELDLEDICLARKAHFSKDLAERMERKWFDEERKAKKEGRTPSLKRVLVKMFMWEIHIMGTIWFFSALARSVTPIFLLKMLQYFEKSASVSLQSAYIYGFLVIFVNLIGGSLTMRHSSRYGQNVGMKIRIAISAVIYRKILRMEVGSLNESAAGKVVNLLANDLLRFDSSFSCLPNLWVAPINTIIVAYLMYDIGGWYAMVGLVVMLLQSFPLQGYFSKLLGKMRGLVAERTDRRIKVMNEIVSGMKVIKMYTWEKPFEAVVEEARKNELAMVKKASILRSFFISFRLFAEKVSLYAFLLAYSLCGNRITSSMVFSVAQYFGVLRTSLAGAFSMAMTSFSETIIAVNRVQEFLNLGDREDLSSHINLYYASDGILNEGFLGEKTEKPLAIMDNDAVIISNVEASWNTNDINPALDAISLRIPKGSLCAIIGPVGSGKSSLVHLLLKELVVKSGSVSLGGDVSYAAQEPWIFLATIRENILFGLDYDVEKYNQVVKVCALEDDFRQIPQGDMALVGERGVSLSGGQRARINLARAVYRKADIYILDDPLSAVDAAVGRQLFDQCISGYLKSFTRILVTHQLDYVMNADLIVIITNGKIECAGTYRELSSIGENYSKLLTAIEDDQNIEEDQSKLLKNKKDDKTNKGSDEMSEKNEVEVLEEEERVVGDIHITSLVIKYFREGNSWWYFGFVTTLLIVGQIVSGLCDYWVSIWSTNQEEMIKASHNSDKVSSSISPNSTDFSIYEMVGPLTTVQYISIYSAILAVCILLSILRASFVFIMCLKSSQKLHNLMFHRILETVTRFFDRNPSGRIMNRFSKDIGQMDEAFPPALMESLQCYLILITGVVIIAITLPISLVPIFIIGIITYFMARWYIRSIRSIKRIEGVMKSPMFSQVNTTLSGMTTIRSNGAEGKCIAEFDKYQDDHTSVASQVIDAGTTISWWIDLLFGLYNLVVVFAFPAMNDDASSAKVGLAITQAMGVFGMLQYGILQGTEAVALMTNVERIYQYTKLEKEENITNGDIEKPKNWPSNGLIEFKGLSLKYDEKKPPVLRDLNVYIQAGWKVGIVGRTGAGKTSLISALFRLAKVEGHIFIDGIDSSKLSLWDLRSSISIIPQEPVLFSATVRYNLDPSSQYDDITLWRALEVVELKESIVSLDFKVTQGGSNFSIGQRQLICLARAIVKNNKILILDEATANVDPRTDGFIQKTIREIFADCTVLTIAHRLNTIMDSDRVLVMHSGKVVEFDQPYVLLNKPDGHFNKMVKETGSNIYSQLYSISKETYESTNGREAS